VTTPTVEVDIRADLQNEDETGYVWAYLDRADHPERIVVGAVVIAGGSGGRCLANVVDIVAGPGGKIVHLNLVAGSVAKFERTRIV
jgi:hypothetical protein